LYFIDSDDYIERKALGKILAFMEKNELDFCGFGSKRTPDRNLSGTPDWSPLEEQPEILTGLALISKQGYSSGVWWYIFRKDILERNDISFEPGTLVEDGPFTTKLLIYAERTAVLPITLYYYYENAQSISKTDDKERRWQLIEGLFSAIKQFGHLMKLAKEKGADAAALRKMQSHQESYVFILLVREVKHGMPFETIKERLAILERESLLPKRNRRFVR
jgi:hypothetical protein